MASILLESAPMDAYGQMALDEILLESAPKNQILLRPYQWSSHAITFGYFQAFADVQRQAELGRAGKYALVRRMTGGGMVFHDGDITFSLIFPWDRLTDASWVYKEIHRGIHLGLKAKGLKTRLWSPPNKQHAAAMTCFSGPSPMDLVLEDGSKCLGGALRRKNGVGLYQGSMRTEGFGVGRELLTGAVADGIAQAWKVQFNVEQVGDPVSLVAQGLSQRKYNTDVWNKRR